MKVDSSFEAFVFYFSKNPSDMYDFKMHCVKIVGLSRGLSLGQDV